MPPAVGTTSIVYHTRSLYRTTPSKLTRLWLLCTYLSTYSTSSASISTAYSLVFLSIPRSNLMIEPLCNWLPSPTSLLLRAHTGVGCPHSTRSQDGSWQRIGCGMHVDRSRDTLTFPLVFAVCISYNYGSVQAIPTYRVYQFYHVEMCVLFFTDSWLIPKTTKKLDPSKISHYTVYDLLLL